MQIRDKILLACSIANEIPNINQGGCCVFAALLGQQLERMGIAAWGVAAANEAWADAASDPEDVRPQLHNPFSITEWSAHGTAFYHVLLRFKLDGKLYQCDSTGITPALRKLRGRPYVVKRGSFSVPELVAFANDAGYWNEAFSRKRGIPLIKLAIDTAFNKEINNVADARNEFVEQQVTA